MVSLCFVTHLGEESWSKCLIIRRRRTPSLTETEDTNESFTRQCSGRSRETLRQWGESVPVRLSVPIILLRSGPPKRRDYTSSVSLGRVRGGSTKSFSSDETQDL